MNGIEKYYTLEEELGRGTFSIVRKGVSKKNGESAAVKIIDKSRIQDKKDMLKAEVDILKNVEHPNIVLLKEMFETQSYIFLVMELISGGELFDKICERGSYNELDASKIVRDILQAVNYLHKKGIMHRDLKPENLLFESSKPDAPIKLADFGLSAFVGDENMLKTACGTPGYVAPEVLLGYKYTVAVDMWSVGVIMYILLCGFPPFYEDNVVALFEQIIEGNYSFPDPYWTEITDSAKHLISQLLQVEPEKRYSAEQALKHPWVIGATAPKTDMKKVLEKMREFNAKRKFKTAILATIASNRLAPSQPSS